jgi:hypothetical protein
MSRDETEEQSTEESRRRGDRRKRSLPVENDKRSTERRDTRGVMGLIDDVIPDPLGEFSGVGFE